MSNATAGSRVATDVGGTFTDLVYLHTDRETGRQEILTAKSDTTPPDFEQGVLDVIRKSGVAARDVAFMAHGTTVVINALTERKGVKTALVTTTGFRDSLEIARGNRPDFFNLFYKKPEPFVPRYLRREVPGRITPTGTEREPLDLSGLPAILDDFRAQGVQAVAICLLHAYANPAHETAVLARVRELWPDVSVVASHEITREWREYERSNTAVLSAYVQPIAERYLSRLRDGVARNGFEGQIYVMQSNCGVDSLEHVKQIPITMVESGPASGFWGAAALGRLIGEPNVLALDIGGTTAKCSLIEGGNVRIMTDYWIERDRQSAGYPIMVPVVDLVEIGNGGGSIAWVDDFGKLHVGPRSAGALPGPAAYGRGGLDATTTDANLALGCINPDYFRGGESRADMAAVDRALDQDRGHVRGDAPGGGAGNSADRQQQHDQRPQARVRQPRLRPARLHARGLRRRRWHARRRARQRARHPQGGDPARGRRVQRVGHARERPAARLLPDAPEPASRPTTPTWSTALITELEAHALEQFAARGRSARARAIHPLRQVPLREPGTQRRSRASRRNHHCGRRRRRRRSLSRNLRARVHLPSRCAVEFVGVHLVAYAEVGKLTPAKLSATGAKLADARKAEREVDYELEGIHVADVYDGTRLEPGMTFAGPAIVETPGTTVVVHPGDEVRLRRVRESAYRPASGWCSGRSLGMSQTTEFDPITLEIIQTSLQATADEMFAAMRRTAMSAIIYEVLDMGTGITDGRGQLASSGAGIPAFVGVLDKAVQRVLEINPPEEIREGDIFATNDPYYGGVTHLNDVVLAMPVFADRELVAWTANIAHWNDVGGMVPGSISTDAREIYQEGLRLPAVKLVDRGNPDQIGDAHHGGELASAGLPPGRHVGRHRVRADRRQPIARAHRKVRPRNVPHGDGALHGLRRAGVAAGAQRACRKARSRSRSPRTAAPSTASRWRSPTRSSSSTSATTPIRTKGRTTPAATGRWSPPR